MPRPPAALPEWLLRDLGPTLGLAAALTGSRPGAVDLVTQALARDRSWTALAGELDPSPRLRASVVRTFLASPLGRSLPPVRSGLDALTGPARAAVVLRDGERLTTGEIACLLDRPAKRVASDLAEIPPGAHDPEIAELTALAPAPATVADRFADTVRRVRTQRGRRTGLLTAATLVVLAAVALPTLVLPRLPADVKPATEWRFSHEVRPLEDWRITYRAIYPDYEQTNVVLPGPDDEETTCLVTVSTVPGEEQLPARGDSRATSVGGRPGELIDTGGNNLILAWQYGDEAWATVSCPNRPVPVAGLQQVAATVRFTDRRQLLPFMLDALPEGYRIRTVGEAFAEPDWGPFVVLDPPQDSYWPILLIGPKTSDADQGIATERCLGPDQSICVTAGQSDDQIPVQPGVGRSLLATVVRDLRLAPDPTDRAGWFDATGLPR
ncbi:hypothetical protein GCM10022204_14290 [Microlunatus aurantiacus]|uniref:DNA-directed RNA polymerase specialized sigma24 family protein n=1 Tax=Microlunatus aurantiacus TaxID=446786 RepID=A0ABP7D3S9_9ACTN